MPNNDKYRLQQEQEWAPFDHHLGMRLLKDVAEKLDRAGIPYYLEGGTLLGLVRDGKLLPWDDDMDISVSSEHIDRASRVLLPLLLKGWRIDKRRWKLYSDMGLKGTRIVKIRDRSRGLFKTGRVYLDILAKNERDGFVYWQAKDRLMRVSNEYYDGFDSIKVDGFEFKAPKNYKQYLTEKYGDWSTPVKEWDCGKDEKTIFK